MHEGLRQDSVEQTRVRLCGTGAIYKGQYVYVEDLDYYDEGSVNECKFYIVKHSGNRNEIVYGSELDYEQQDLGYNRYNALSYAFFSPVERSYKRGIPVSQIRQRRHTTDNYGYCHISCADHNTYGSIITPDPTCDFRHWDQEVFVWSKYHAARRIRDNIALLVYKGFTVGRYVRGEYTFEPNVQVRMPNLVEEFKTYGG